MSRNSSNNYLKAGNNISCGKTVLRMEEYHKKWLLKADKDLKSASHAIEFRDYELSAFLCQQSVEKGLKSVYIKRFNELKKTHDLLFLGTKLELPEDLMRICEELNSFYFVTRYPDVSDDVCTEEDALNSLKDAKKVLKWIKKNI
jgi:HEPN domain-containing protein